MGIVFLGAACTWLILRGLIPKLSAFWIDVPNSRSSHLKPTPRGGGVVFVVLVSASSGISMLDEQAVGASVLPLIAAPLAILGFFDDRYDLSASWRYSLQLLTASLFLFVSPLIHYLFSDITSPRLLLVLFSIFLLIAITAVINFINFMDGLDGLVAVVWLSHFRPWQLQLLRRGLFGPL